MTWAPCPHGVRTRGKKESKWTYLSLGLTLFDFTEFILTFCSIGFHVWNHDFGAICCNNLLAIKHPAFKGERKSAICMQLEPPAFSNGKPQTWLCFIGLCVVDDCR